MFSDTVAQGMPCMTRLAISLLLFTAQVHRGQQILFNTSPSDPWSGEASVRVPDTEGIVQHGLIASTPAAIPVVSALRAGLFLCLCLCCNPPVICGAQSKLKHFR
jgi:hypothetical protein